MYCTDRTVIIKKKNEEKRKHLHRHSSVFPMEHLRRSQCIAELPDSKTEKPSLLILAKGGRQNVGERTVRHENPIRAQRNNNGSMGNHKPALIGIYH